MQHLVARLGSGILRPARGTGQFWLGIVVVIRLFCFFPKGVDITAGKPVLVLEQAVTSERFEGKHSY